MKTKIQLTLFVIIALTSGVFSQISSSKWQAQPVVIDGEAADWVSIPRFFNAESNVQYEFRNNANNLYVIIKATERATQMQLQRAGFALRLKAKTSPPSKFGIVFHPSKMESMPSMRNNGGDRIDVLVEKSAQKPELVYKDSALLEGFLYAKGIIASDNEDPLRICFARNKGNRDQTIYEFRIPLRELYGNNFVLENISNIPLQLQVVINDLSQSKNTSGRKSRGMQGGMSGGRGGRGGSMGGEEGMQGGGSMQGSGRGGMGGGEMGQGDEMGEKPQMQEGNSHSMSKKSFNIDFKLSTDK